jgi:LuxR family transcriptional regulator, maltose regulon positive regulatory protein
MNAALPTRSSKFTPPASGPLMPRPALAAHLQEARTCPLVWVAAPPGSGKTTLLANLPDSASRPTIWYRLDGDDATIPGFVDALAEAVAAGLGRRRASLAVAATGSSVRQAVRAALRDLPAGAALVIDDLDVSMLPAMETLLPVIADEVPTGTTVFVATHLSLPPSLARHCANRRVAVIPPDALQLDVAETAALLRMVAPGHAGDASIVHEATQGWLVGTLLLATDTTAPDPTQAPPAIADYFARHVFDGLDLETRQVLLHVAGLPTVNLQEAAALSQMPHAGPLLGRLAEQNLFVTRCGDGRFAIHPMFRAYLARERDATLPAARRRTLLDQTARLAETSGLIDLAADLYAAASSWHALLKVLRRAVPPLLETHRIGRVARWLDALPDSVGREDAWVVLWRGVLERSRDRDAALARFDVAWQAFTRQCDVTGLAATLDAAFTALQDVGTELGTGAVWRERLEVFGEGTGDQLPPRAEAHLVACGQVLMEAGLDHPLLARWARRVTAIVRAIDDPGLAGRLVAFGAAYHFWRGAVVRSAALLESHDLPCAADDRRLSAVLVGSLLGSGPAASPGGIDRCLVPRRELSALLDFVQPGEPGAGGNPRGRIHALARRGRLAEAIDLQEVQADHLRELRLRLPLALAVLDAGALCAMVGQPARAWRHLDEACALAEEMDSDLLRWNAGLWRAWCADAIGSTAAPELAAAAVRVGARHGYMGCHPWWNATMMTRVMRHAVEHGCEKAYVTRLIRTRGLLPDSPEPDGWPWPVRVHTLGRFGITIDESPIVFQGRAQRRPMDLLKAVIAHGGRDIALGTIIEAVWPEAEGDAGRKSFDVALLRLRRLLGRDDSLLLGEGKVSLNDKVCWVDVWSLERLLGGISDDDTPGTALGNARRLLARYRGPFLNLEEPQPWMIYPRERVTGRAVRAVLALGRKLEGARLWTDAATLYHGMLDVSPMHEELVRRLMHCLEQLGNQAEARAVFERYRRMLASLLGQQPSAEALRTYLDMRSSLDQPAGAGDLPGTGAAGIDERKTRDAESAGKNTGGKRKTDSRKNDKGTPECPLGRKVRFRAGAIPRAASGGG